jgi:predicted adenylyl cyclase CyaB
LPRAAASLSVPPHFVFPGEFSPATPAAPEAAGYSIHPQEPEMARNIEIKARAQHFDQLRERAAQLATDAPLIFRQQDFFYDVPRGRLKLRQFDDGTPAELIFYQRDDRDGPKASYYTRSPVTNPEAMHALLATALTTRGIVSKERHVYLSGRTRIHLDRVDGLGDFVELEVVLAQDDDEEGGHAEARAMFQSLGVSEADLVPVAYVDLLNAEDEPQRAA